ncbi:MAG: putative toxin-antitoxin system toxin component, PIN family [Rubrivivax sp.]
MKIFLDTNVLVAAFAARGLCADVFRLAATDHELLIGAPVLVEVRRILENKLRMPAPARNEVLQVLRRFVQVPAAKAPILLGINDSDDEWIVACAVAASADVFVTGDKALLGLHRVQAMPIVSPREFWTRLTTA